MIVSTLQPSVWPEKSSTTAAAGGALDVAKAAFLAATGSAGAGWQSSGDDDVVVPGVDMSGDLPAVEQPGSVSERLENGSVCVCVYVCDLSRKALVNFCCEDRGSQVIFSLRARLGHGLISSHRRTRRGSERENKLKLEGGKQGTQSEKKRPLRNASGRHQRWVPTFVLCPSCKRFVLSLVPCTWQHHGAIPMYVCIF